MTRPEIIRAVFLGTVLATAQGCAALSDSLPNASTDLTAPVAGLASVDAPVQLPASGEDPAPGVPSEPAPTQETPSEAIVVAADRPPAASPEAPPAEPAKKDQDEFYDPFAKKEDSPAGGEDYDPWEGFNSAMFEFNRKFDKYVLKPVAKVYDKILPNAVQKGISNFSHNARFGPRLINNMLQLKIKGTGLEIGRFLINSTLGIGGLFDPAKNWFRLETPDEDTGQTLGAYGVPPGPYLVLPLLPPFTLRDFIGAILDFGADPVNYFVFPTFEVDNWPSLIAHKNRDTTTIAQFGTRAEEIVNYRSLNLETFEGVEEATVDLYSAVRNAYLQKRARAIRE